MKDSKKNIGLIAYEKIKKKLLQNELNFGQQLLEDNFSRDLGISRTPVREALIMLEKEGIITRSPGRGFYIQRFSVKDVDDFYHFRNILETASADLIIPNVTNKDIDALYKILEKVGEFIERGNAAQAMTVGLQFHIKIIEICKNDMFIKSLKNCYDKLILVSWSYHQLESCTKSAKEHGEILEALESRDLDKLRTVTRQHLDNARERTLDLFKFDTQRLYIMP
jgi:DNA-binding GntR family transcriptional regulator